MNIVVQKPGIHTTVQDLGRFGYQKLGINPGGVMDPVAARLVNILLGNRDSDAVLEMHYPAPRYLFGEDAICAIGGADFVPAVDGSEIDNWRAFAVSKGNVLSFGIKLAGNRAYLAVSGGLDIEDWLGSASTNIIAQAGGIFGRALRANDEIELRSTSKLNLPVSSGKISHSLIPNYSSHPTVRVIAGAEFDCLSNQGLKTFLKNEFTVSMDSNRMGFRLIGKPINLSAPREIISSAVSVGTIQLLPDGQLIVLMADHQTTGGYPRIAHVISYDLPLVAQLGTNDKMTFQVVDTKEAEDLALQFEKNLSFLRAACRFQTNS